MSPKTMKARAERRRRVRRELDGWKNGRVRPVDIRQGDTVEVIAGKDKGKRGVVERVLAAEQRIAVRGVNLLKRHTKAGVAGNIQGGIVDFDGPISYSNVMLVCNRCDKRTRVGRGVDDEGNSYIVCKNCGERYVRTVA